MRTVWLIIAAVSGLALLSLSMWVEPHHIPSQADDVPTWLAWWATSLVLLWFVASLWAWRVALESESEALFRCVQRWSLPGVGKLAERILATSLLLVPACSVATSEAPPTLQLIADGLQPPTPQTTIQPRVPENTTTALERALPDPADSVSNAEPPVGAAESPTAPLADAIAEFQRAIQAQSASTGQMDLAPNTPAINPELDRFRASDVHIVKGGDHLWGIAHDTLEQRLERHPSNGEIASYWRRLIQDNRGMLASGNPNLIYPGERITLPA